MNIADLKQAVSYDPNTGELIWKNPPKNHSYRKGKPALTSLAGAGYRYGKVLGQWCYLHQVAVAIMTGKWPEDQVDHIDGDILNNRWSNLRPATAKQNSRNRSGVVGVYWQKRGQTWRAKMKVDRKDIHLGNFKNKDDAIAARKQAEKNFGFHINHGRKM